MSGWPRASSFKLNKVLFCLHGAFKALFLSALFFVACFPSFLTWLFWVWWGCMRSDAFIYMYVTVISSVWKECLASTPVCWNKVILMVIFMWHNWHKTAHSVSLAYAIGLHTPPILGSPSSARAKIVPFGRSYYLQLYCFLKRATGGSCIQVGSRRTFAYTPFQLFPPGCSRFIIGLG